jgi:uncharacterized protein
MLLVRLNEVLQNFDQVAVAVSGGIDSLTLATAAHRLLGSSAAMHHATSPAVPAEATERTRTLAATEGWSLDVFDAGEFADPRYRANPVNRCFFCKTSLYGAVANRTGRTILSGTNLDDLGEYRPGLMAARDHGVRHPFVEAGIDKRSVRALATELGLGVLADLPSSPCLASRVETGLRIEPATLSLIHQAETRVAAALSPRTVRCRVRAGAIVIELDQPTLATIEPRSAEALLADLNELAGSAGLALPISFAPYRVGSAFLVAAA